ncbi:Tetraacyldisaccharide 4'-kinase [Candidatus Magnetomorum sp. HK-1]|nr:Tetraacyldisaccharide 4'-kinase [Candidatus Magnetomorum sp. HK-1]
MKKTIIQKIETIMRNDNAKGGLAFILYVLSLIYAVVMKIRALFYAHGIFRTKRLSCKVISIGNITVGGSGKTPMTIYLARMLQRLGFNIVIISRGYRGQYERRTGIVSDGNKLLMDADSAGDEPFLMAGKLKGVPVIVGKDRYECGCLAIQKFNPQVILLDDAFQHLRLHRDVDMVLMDRSRPLGNSHVIPRGMLREPAIHLKRGHIFVLTRATQSQLNDISNIEHYIANKPILRCRHVPDQLMQTNEKGHLILFDPSSLAEKPIFAFSGIANNEDFQRMINTLKYQTVGALHFPDHHVYSDADLSKIIAQAHQSGAKCLVTTEKDYVKIIERVQWNLPLFALGIRLSFGNETNYFENVIKEKLDSF